MNDEKHPKPGRPLGVTLAVILSVLLFSVLPLAQIAFALSVQYRLQNIDWDMPFAEDGSMPIISGGNVNLVEVNDVFWQVVLGVAFFIVAIFAWRGRPAWIRFVFYVFVIVLTVVSAVLTLIPLLTPPNLAEGFDSGQSVDATFGWGRLLFTVLIPVYVLWYMNRAPARAFYRGYYLEAPAAG